MIVLGNMLDDIIMERRKKLDAIRGAGIEPYPARVGRIRRLCGRECRGGRWAGRASDRANQSERRGAVAFWQFNRSDRQRRPQRFGAFGKISGAALARRY